MPQNLIAMRNSRADSGPVTAGTVETNLGVGDVGDGFVDQEEEGANGGFEMGDGRVFFFAMGEAAGGVGEHHDGGHVERHLRGVVERAGGKLGASPVISRTESSQSLRSCGSKGRGSMEKSGVHSTVTLLSAAKRREASWASRTITARTLASSAR